MVILLVRVNFWFFVCFMKLISKLPFSFATNLYIQKSSHECYLLQQSPLQRTDARVEWVRRAYPRRKDVCPDTKDIRNRRCEERRIKGGRHVYLKFLCYTRNFDQNVCPVRRGILRKEGRTNLYGKILYRKNFLWKILKVPLQRTVLRVWEFCSKRQSVGGGDFAVLNNMPIKNWECQFACNFSRQANWTGHEMPPLKLNCIHQTPGQQKEEKKISYCFLWRVYVNFLLKIYTVHARTSQKPENPAL